MKLFLSASLLLATAVVTLAQTASIRDIDLSANYIHSKTDNNGYRLVYKVTKKDYTHVFRKIEYDAALTPVDTVEIKLSENFRILDVAKSTHYEVYAFGSLQTGKVQFVWLDLRTGKQQHTVLNRVNWWSKNNKVTLQATRVPDVFCVTHQLDKKHTEIQFISPKEKGRVVKTIHTGKRVEIREKYLHDDKMIFTVVAESQNNKKIKYQLLAINGVTGQELYMQEISNKGNMFAADQIKRIDTSLYLLGRRYTSKKINHTQPGRTSLLAVDLKTGNIKDTKINGIAPFTTWSDVIQPDGASLFLVGETFKSGTSGSYFAKSIATGILTLGLFTVTWNAIHFRDVVIVEINNEQQKPQTVPLPHRRVQVGYFLPAYAFATQLTHTWQSRYFGTNNASIYLRKGDVLTAYTLKGNTSRDIATLQETSGKVIVHHLGESAIIVRKPLFEKRLELERFNFSP